MELASLPHFLRDPFFYLEIESEDVLGARHNYDLLQFNTDANYMPLQVKSTEATNDITSNQETTVTSVSR